ncbi:MAG: phosphatidylinositol-3-phosphatase [Actinomycetota bacterium]|jgi:hypothetical protein|nr:phosphatidylinositol-3-phosphatase [Actinomycetota bacterium]
MDLTRRITTTRRHQLRSGVLGLLVVATGLGVAGPGNASGTPNASAPCAVTSVVPTWKHVIWIIMENRSFSQIIGSSNAPYVNSLATRCGLATNYRAVAHPSLPNYLAMVSGSTQGVTDDKPPSSHQLKGPSIFSQLGTGWTSLEESMPSKCALASSGTYAVKHNPVAYFTTIRTACAARDIPLASMPDMSARFTFVTPNLCNDMHDCSVQAGDKWLATFIPKILNSSTYSIGSTAVLLTWDENDGSSSNQVATVVISPTVAQGARSSTAFTHYSMLRTTEEMLRLPLLGNAASATSMRSAFRL